MKRIRNSIAFVLLILATASMRPAQAELIIEITGGIESALPIAVVPFDTSRLSSQLEVDIAEIVASDLVVLPYLSATGSGVVKLAYSYHRPVVVSAVDAFA